MNVQWYKVRIPLACCAVLFLCLIYRDWNYTETFLFGRQRILSNTSTIFNGSRIINSVINGMDFVKQSKLSETVRKENSNLSEIFQSACCKCRDSCQRKSETMTKCKALKYSDNRHFVRAPDPVGRLGNLLFEFSATVGIAATLGFKPIIKSTNPLLRVFSIDPKYMPIFKLINILDVNENQWQMRTLKDTKNYSSYNISLHGFFQSWKHFSNVADCIKDLLVIRQTYVTKAKKFLEQENFRCKTLVGIHVRRTDMMTKGSQNLGRLVASRNYIAKSMSFFRTRCNNTHFIVCTDDMRWSKENVIGSDVTFTSSDAAVDFTILTLCDHVIITVGTFGWWAGWLSGGTVVYLSDYPRKGSHLDSYHPKDSYYPPAWIGFNNSAS